MNGLREIKEIINHFHHCLGKSLWQINNGLIILVVVHAVYFVCSWFSSVTYNIILNTEWCKCIKCCYVWTKSC